jgi:hypothetical protein
LLIDPGEEVDQLLEVVRSGHLTVQSILLTHAHVDHVLGVARAKQALGSPVYLHRDDLLLYESAPQQAEFFGLRCDPLPQIDRFYDVSKTLSFGDHDVSVHHTPTLPGRRLPCDWSMWNGEAGFVRGRYCLRSIGRPIPWRRLPDADLLITEVLVAFGMTRLLGTRPADTSGTSH